MPNKEGMMDGSYEDMMGGKGGLEGKGKKGKMGGKDDWLLKRGIWEKQVPPKLIKKLEKCLLQKPDTVAMVVREVMVSAVCNTSKQPQLNQGSVEFNVTDEFLNSTG